MDKLDKATRSRVMSRNRSRGRRTTEVRLRYLMVRAGITGWRLGHASSIPGSPDFIFSRKRVAVFVDGCFWHACERCRTVPETRRAFWTEKLERNKSRDKTVNHRLRSMGWVVVRAWEHELRKPHDAVMARLRAVLAEGRALGEKLN